MSQAQDEQSIRDVIATWMSATAEGNIERVLELMAEDVVFLTCGQPPMRGRDAFAQNLRAVLGKVRISGRSEIEEIEVSGEHAFCRANLAVTITPVGGGPSKVRTGSTLSVFKKTADRRWLLYRDANLLGSA